MQLDQGPFTDVQITGNRLYNSCGPGFWIVDKIGGEGQLDISWNLVYGCGSNHGIYWAAGVISNGFDEYFSHNVFDSCYLGSFVSYDVNSGWETSATSTFDSNIFTNTQPGTYSGDGGYGIYNKIGQNIVSQNNCFWQNSAGDVKGCSISSTDIHVDPKTTATPSGWRYVNGQWECDMVQPLPMDEIAGINNSYKPITEKEIQEEDIFLAGLLTVEFPENAITRQSGDSINYNVPTQQVGDVAGGVKIVGFNNWSKIDNENFISSTNDVLVKSVVMRNQDLDMYTANPKKIDKTVTVDMNNTTVTATLTAKVSSPSQKNILIGNKTTGKTKTRKYTFTDTYSPAPKILPQPAEVTGVIYQYPTKFELNVLGENYTEIEYKVGENITKHTFMIGARNETDTGVDFTEYTRIEFWDDNNSIPHIGDWISVPGKYDPETVKVTAKTPYKEYQVNKFEIVDKKFPEKDKIIAWWVYPKMVFYILCACYIGYLLSRIKNH
jgi:hypothetical protein